VEAVRKAHQEFTKMANDVRLNHLGELREENGRSYFFLSDPAKNSWEITTPKDVVSQGANSI
jgi:hypothetical protein